MVSIAVWNLEKWLRGRHFITQPQAGHLKRLISSALKNPSKKVLEYPCPHTWLKRQRGHITGFCQGNFFPRRLTSLRFTSTNSIIESLRWGPAWPPGFGRLDSPKIQPPFFKKKMASDLRPFNSIILACLSIHSENTGGVFLIINREPTAGQFQAKGDCLRPLLSFFARLSDE